MQYDLIHNDILTWCNAYEGPRFHAMFCDPPYHLTDQRDPRRGFPARQGENGEWNDSGRVKAQGGRGFMNARWDGGDLVFRPETWAAFGNLLYPGAFGMAFASSRGWHRMAVAIEDAGFIIHPSIFLWGFGSGFPKATRVRDDERFAGHRYGLQAIKPATEPVIVFQKPYQGRPVDCITTTGAGVLNIDAGRVATSETTERFGGRKGQGGVYGDSAKYQSESHDLGRWPANLILGHSDQCTADQCVEGCAVRRLGEQSGESRSKANKTSDERKTAFYQADSNQTGGYSGERNPNNSHDDSGTAARFFFNADYALDKLEAADPLYYCAKASTAEREAGLSDFDPTTVDDGGQTPIDNPYLRGETTRRNIHATVKPLSLNKHLASLLLPPAEYAPRRLLIPFGGVASEMIGAMLAGWDEVTGIELEAEHVAIGRARLAWWSQMARKLGSDDPATILEMAGEAAEAMTIYDFLG